MRRRIADGDAARTHAFLGVRTRAELPLADDVAGWRRAGASVTVCLSQPGEPLDGGGDLARGYVQDVIAARSRLHDLDDAHVFAVGMATMVDALRGVAPSLGVPAERVHTNHGS